MKLYWLFNILIAFALISGCSARKVLAPVDDRAAPSSTKVVIHEVAPGDTLYSIAWRYNLDYKKLASANGIGRSYRIYPGQKIRLSEHSKPAKRSVTSSSKPASKRDSSTQSRSKVAENKSVDRLKNKTPSATKSLSGETNPVWNWPSKGRLIRDFSGANSLSKGIDIAGNLGEPVRAASSGTVVYAGEGLRGYGKLIIIKHSEKYLSAYAHNRKLRVKEGDVVSARDKIAEMGQSGTNTVKLHFEIRYDGKPVNPLKFLPPK